MESEYNLIICIVNSGFSEAVMDAAKTAGARGGTVLSARGTAKTEAEALFHISIHPEKEMVFIIVLNEIRDAVLKALYEHVGLNTESQGIAFSVPVDDVVGINMKPKQKEPEE